jgi:type I restriction enzyme S subunit
MVPKIPEGWVETTLGEVIEIFDHKRIPLNSKERAKRQGVYPYYGASGIFDYIDDYIFDGRYLLVAEDGENLNSRKTPVAFFADGKFWVNNHAHIIRGIDGIADDYFLMSHFSNSDISGYITGAAQPKLSQANLKAIKILLPPFSVQCKISAVLSAYDELIEVNTRRIHILEQMAQAVYHECFGKVDTRSLPEGWEIIELGDIAKEVRRSIQPSDIAPETPYFGLEHLPRKSLALVDWGKAGDVQSTKLAFKKGEILFGKIRPYFHKVGVAPLDGVASSDTIIIVPKSPEYFGLVLSCVFSEDFVNQATLTSQGTKMPRANWDVLVKYPVLLPPQPLLEQFNRTIHDFVEMIQNLVFSIRNLRRTRDLLLPRLVSGEVDVEGLELDI